MDETVASPDRTLFRSPRLWVSLALMATAGAGLVLSSTRLTEAGEELHPWPLSVFEGSLLLLAMLVTPLRRVDAHLFVRAVLWGLFAFFGFWATDADRVAPLVAFVSVGTALLALGGLGLDAEHGAFAPRVLRRSLLTMMVVGLCVAHLEGLLAYDKVELLASQYSSIADPGARVVLAVMTSIAPVLLLAGIFGLSRTRSWGLFAYLGALLWSGVIVLASRVAPTAFRGAGAAHLIFGVVMTLVALPVLGALVFKPTRRPTEPRLRIGEWVHGLLVASALATALYVRFVDPRWLDRLLD